MDTDTLEIRTTDGRGLGATLAEPQGRRVLGTAIFAHPMFANKSVFSRPRSDGVARLFFEAGWRTLAFDFRGHGESTCEGVRRSAEERPWTYDDLVRIDLPTVVQAARDRWPRSRVVVVGHSLGGHVALAAQGSGRINADALLVAGANMWLRHLEPGRRVWLLKLAAMTSMAAVAKRFRYFPVRGLRLGSDDESDPYIQDIVGYCLRGRWTSRDGRDDYEANLKAITVPTLSITSTGDRLYCRPECAERMLSVLPAVTHLRITESDDGSGAPGHMGIVTDARSRRVWQRAVAWLAETAPPG